MEKERLKVLLADDDFLVRSYLKSLSVWERAGCEIIGDVRDGEEALAELSMKKADILITDITMPLMDGIELIRKLRAEDTAIYIIVLSCHEEFPFVKEAMRLGADDYLLKNSLEEESLLEVLHAVREQIASRKKVSGEDEKRSKLIEMGSQTLKFRFFNQLLSGSMPREVREERRREAGIRGSFKHSAVITVTMKNWQDWKEGKTLDEMEAYSEQVLKELGSRFRAASEEGEAGLEVIDLGSGVYCCFLDLSETNRGSIMRQWLTHTASACCRFVEEQKVERKAHSTIECESVKSETEHKNKDGREADYGIAVSSICIGEDGIRQAFLQAREVMKQSFYHQDGMLQYEHLAPMGDQLPAAAVSCLKEIKSCLGPEDKEKRERLTAEALKSMEEERTDSRYVLLWLKDMDQQLGIVRTPEVYAGLYSFCRVKKLAAAYEEELTQEAAWPDWERAGAVVQRALVFMKENFRGQIGLTETAEAAGVNAAYLSYLFKQEMGIGFANYLMERRLDYVGIRLISYKGKIKEAAALAGFQDYYHFSKVFKKYYGVSPADYIKKMKP